MRKDMLKIPESKICFFEGLQCKYDEDQEIRLSSVVSGQNTHVNTDVP